jgi:hypothetical protein
MFSFKVFVKVFGETSFNTNGVAFATRWEAEKYAVDLANRWMLVETWRVEESNDPINYKWVDGHAVSLDR